MLVEGVSLDTTITMTTIRRQPNIQETLVGRDPGLLGREGRLLE